MQAAPEENPESWGRQRQMIFYQSGGRYASAIHIAYAAQVQLGFYCELAVYKAFPGYSSSIRSHAHAKRIAAGLGKAGTNCNQGYYNS
jgi:hypothetical protein